MLGRYEVIKHLASGGMAEVLIARSSGIEGFERFVVIKRIRSEQKHDASFVSMFLDEARLAAALHHANIVQVYDIGQEDGEYFFAMEYVHGEDLRRVLTHVAGKQLQLPIQHVVTIMTAAAAALHYAHDLRGRDGKPLGIVHRDVSPANILVGYDGTVKVVDFGIAKAALRSTETKSGTLKGKIAYMSPEQCNGQPVDRRCDVFALGIVAYELVTARRLFKADSDFLTMSKIVAGDIPKPSTHRPELSPVFESIIMRALSIDPAMRYQSADEMRVALERYADRSGLRTSTTALADYITGQLGRRPEPWLVESDDEPDIEVGAARPSSEFDEVPEPDGKHVDTANLPLSSKVWRPSGQRNAALAPNEAAHATRAGWHPTANVPTGSGTPMAFEATGPTKTRRGLVLGSAIGGATIAAVTVAAFTTGIFSRDSGTASEVAPAVRAAAPVTVPVPTPTPIPVPVPVPIPVATPAVTTPPPPVEPPPRASKPRPAIAKKTPKPVAKPAPKPGGWDPDDLFYKHK